MGTILQHIMKGERPKKPSALEKPAMDIDEDTWDVMNRCWDANPKLRPSVLELRELFSNRLVERPGGV
jgi:hypothetical protein